MIGGVQTVTSLLFVVAVLLTSLTISLAHADATVESVLDCTPTVVEPGQNVTCTIMVRDSLQEPTVIFSTNDFMVTPIASIPATVLTVSPLTVGVDPTTVVFTVSAATGTNVAINAYVKATGEVIRGSGVTVAVLVWPATRVGTITCDSSNYVDGALPLRSTTVCTADVTGSNNLPAVVRPSDVYLTEDHFAGSFVYISGAKQLVFRFTAPTTIVAAFDAFKLRVTLASSDAVYSISIPMAYPKIAATAASSLQCSGLFQTVCYVLAQDASGPVMANFSQFIVEFERLDATNNIWVPSTTEFNVTTAAGASRNLEQLSWSLIVNNRVSTQRIRTYVSASSSSSSKQELSGSPFIFNSGTAPTPSSVSFRGCVDKYVAAGNSTLCTIDLLDGVSGDTSYYTVTSTMQGSSAISGLTYVAVEATSKAPAIVFTYTASATILTRTEDSINVLVAGSAVIGSPTRVIQYIASTQVSNDSDVKHVPAIIAIGLIVYGTALSIGGGLFWKRQRNQHRVQVAREQRRREEHKRMLQGLVEEHHTIATAYGRGSKEGSAFGQEVASGAATHSREASFASSTTGESPHSDTEKHQP